LAAVFGLATQVCVGQTTIASKRNHDFYVSLMSKSGELAKKDDYCALFSRTKDGEPTQAEGVFVEFAEQVGKIRERATKVPLALDNSGRYCGRVNLGKQYYQPDYYYIDIHYIDGSRKRRRCSFFLTLK